MDVLPDAFMKSIHAMLSIPLVGMQTNQCYNLYVGDILVGTQGNRQDTAHVAAGSLWIGSRRKSENVYSHVSHGEMCACGAKWTVKRHKTNTMNWYKKSTLNSKPTKKAKNARNYF